jgi:hypothetical protein
MHLLILWSFWRILNAKLPSTLQPILIVLLTWKNWTRVSSVWIYIYYHDQVYRFHRNDNCHTIYSSIIRCFIILKMQKWGGKYLGINKNGTRFSYKTIKHSLALGPCFLHYLALLFPKSIWYPHHSDEKTEAQMHDLPKVRQHGDFYWEAVVWVRKL